MRYLPLMLLLLPTMAPAYTHKDYPFYIDKAPVKKSCNQIEYFKECHELSHYRGKDYIVFRWHDEMSNCNYDSQKEPKCTAIREHLSIMIRKGCLISWCKR